MYGPFERKVTTSW